MDPVVLKRTVKNSVRRNQSPPQRRYVPTRTISPDGYYDRVRSDDSTVFIFTHLLIILLQRDRSRSPMHVDDYDLDRENHFRGGRGGGRRGYSDFDDPRRMDEDEMYRRRLREVRA